MFFFFFKSLLNLKIKSANFSHSGIKKSLSEVALQTRESLKRPYFPLPLSILQGTNLIMLLFSFFAAPVWFPRKSIPHSISGKIHLKENQKNCFSFAPCVFWICSRGLFAVVPLDLNFTNPKSMIFELGWKTQPCLQIMIKNKLEWFCILCVGWTGRKYREISRKIGKNTDKYRKMGDI